MDNGDNHEFDKRFKALKVAANVRGAIEPETEDEEMSSLLEAALTAWISEVGSQESQFVVDARQGGKYPLHARLRQVLDGDRDDEQHWSFRAICHSHGNAILPRIQAARTSAGLCKSVSKRKLVLLRNTAWNKGTKNREALQEFAADGGLAL